jgi:hypothetical protein
MEGENMKLIKLILAICLCSFCCVTGYAEEEEKTSIEQNAPVGVLVDEFGNEYFVEGKEINSLSVNTRSSNSGSKTFEYTLSNVTRASGNNTINDTDGSISVRVYLTIYYSYQGSNYLLTAVSGYWTFLDNGVEVTSSRVSYGCSDGGVTQSIEGRSVSNHYYINTGFNTYVSSSMGAMGQNLTLGLKMTNPNGTSRTWTFYIENNLFNAMA